MSANCNENFEIMLREAVVTSESRYRKKLDELDEAVSDEIVVRDPSGEAKVRALLRHKKRKPHLRGPGAGKWVAALLVAVLVGIGGLALGVEAIRSGVLNFKYKEGQPRTQIDFKDSDRKSSLGKVFRYSLGYVPEGFVLEKTNDPDDDSTYFLYRNDNDEWFDFLAGSLDGNYEIDTWDANVEDILINGYEAVVITKVDVVTKKDLCYLIWYNSECSFNSFGTISKEEMIKIAENVKKE